MDKNKKKGGKFLLSLLLILLCIGAAGITGYAVYTRMPILGHTVNTSKDKKGNTKTDSTNEYINPKNIISSESITHKQESSDDDEVIFEDEYENDDSIYSNTDTIDFESEPVTITTDTSQDTTSQPSISAPTNKPTNNPPIPLPTPEEPTVKPIPNKPLVPPTDNKHTDDDTSSSARHRHKKPSISGVTLDKTEITLNKGDISSPLISTISPSNATGNKIIKWSSKDEAIATVDKDGHITAVGAGTTNIVATTSNGKTAECKVTVLVPPSGIKINSDNFAIDKGLSKTLTATVEPEDCTDKAVTWATSNNDVLSVDDNGKVTAVTPGTATITATTADGKFSSDCEVTVVISIAKLELNKAETTLIKGTEETLTATVTPQDTTEEKKVQWISSDKDICTVDENGKITAVNGGTATITAQVGSHVAECEVTVIVPVSGIEINKLELRLAKDTEETLTANILPEDATDKAVEWSSSNPEIANVNENGKVTGIKVGTAVITVKTHDGGFTADCTVNVVIPVTGINLDKSELSIIRKDTAVLIPTITPDNATDKSVIWSSSNENICTVDENGKVTGTGVGSAVIKATTNDGGLTADCKVTVTPDEYTIAVNAENGKAVGTGTHHVGSDVTLKAVPNAHYHFVNWTQDGKEISTEPEYIIKNINEDINITANFEIDYHTVTVKAGDGGTATGGGRCAYGTEITLTATPNEHYHFTDWSDGAKSAARKITVTKNVDLSANFEIDTFTVTVNGNGGTVSGGGRFAYDTEITLTATPNEHYHFIGWSDGVKSAERKLTVTKDVDLSAVFEIDYHTVTVKAGDGGTVSGGGKFAYGTEIKLTATPNDKYEFEKWSDGNTSENRNYKVTGDTTLTALFKLQPYTWTYKIFSEEDPDAYVILSNSDKCTFDASYHCDDSQGRSTGHILYEFNEPLQLKKGSSLKGLTYDVNGEGAIILINGEDIKASYKSDLGYSGGDFSQMHYIVPKDIKVTTIEVIKKAQASENKKTPVLQQKIFITPLGEKTFMLNSSKTSENQDCGSWYYADSPDKSSDNHTYTSIESSSLWFRESTSRRIYIHFTKPRAISHIDFSWIYSEKAVCNLSVISNNRSKTVTKDLSIDSSTIQFNPKDYSDSNIDWNSITDLEINCHHGRRDISVPVTVYFSDGTYIRLGTSSKHSF